MLPNRASRMRVATRVVQTFAARLTRMKTARRPVLFILGLALSSGQVIQADKAKDDPAHCLNVIAFESYPTKAPDGAFEVTDLESAEFPLIFTRLFLPFSQPQVVERPAGIQLPKQAMFLDVFTFGLPGAKIREGKRLGRYNPIHAIEYKLRFSSWTPARYEIEVDGQHEDLKFRGVRVGGVAEKTKIIRFRHSANRTMYLALTPIRLKERRDDTVPPTPIVQTLPTYPSELSKSRLDGKVRIRSILSAAGKIEAQKLVLLEASDYLFARNSLDTVLNTWLFHPATKGGVPTAIEAVIEVDFRLRQ